jgi:hypothetical protein
MRSYAEEKHDEWWILSAKHGLLDPDGPPIEPYDETLKGESVTKKREWADMVYSELEEAGLLESGIHFVIHAGQDYYGELLPKFREEGRITVEIATKGLTFGETLSFYKEREND